MEERKIVWATKSRDFIVAGEIYLFILRLCALSETINNLLSYSDNGNFWNNLYSDIKWLHYTYTEHQYYQRKRVKLHGNKIYIQQDERKHSYQQIMELVPSLLRTLSNTKNEIWDFHGDKYRENVVFWIVRMCSPPFSE
jgi:hypothetical protein